MTSTPQPEQLGLLRDDLTIAQRFETWKATPGGAQVLRRMYQLTADFYKDYQRYKVKVSQRLIWEKLRHQINRIHAFLKKRGQKMERERGFWLNDHFTAPAVRHMLANHPEWSGMFELREIGKVRKKRRIIVIDQQVQHKRAA